MSEPRFVPFDAPEPLADSEMVRKARAFADHAARRRTLRDFSDRPVPEEVIHAALRAAGSAPSGANRQPWHFVAVSDPAVKRRIREAAEAEEREFYERRAPGDWLEALEPFGTGPEKPFLEIAPWLVAVFAERWGEGPNGDRIKNYYVPESVGLACGLLVAALHHVGLASLTHTPSPMGFLNQILGRPAREKPYLLLVVGHPAEGAAVPDIRRKELDEIANFV